MNERGYDALNIQPETKSAFDAIKDNESYKGSTQDALLRHLIIEAGYGDYIEDTDNG